MRWLLRVPRCASRRSESLRPSASCATASRDLRRPLGRVAAAATRWRGGAVAIQRGCRLRSRRLSRQSSRPSAGRLVRVLALDYGSARCGCAVSDPTGVLATPIEPVPAPGTRRGLAKLRSLVTQVGADRVVVGLPLSLSGDDTAQTAETRAFAARLETELAVPVELFDERFTTRLAARAGGDAIEDSRAAAHMLAGWLAARHVEGRRGSLPRPSGTR